MLLISDASGVQAVVALQCRVVETIVAIEAFERLAACIQKEVIIVRVQGPKEGGPIETQQQESEHCRLHKMSVQTCKYQML